MRILFYSPTPFINSSGNTGYGTHIREVIGGFREHAQTVEALILGDDNTSPIYTRKDTPSLSEKIAKKIIPKILWRTMKEYRLLTYDRKAEIILGKKINEFKPDVIYERAAYFQSSGYKMAKKYKIKYFVEVNAPFAEEMKNFENTNSLLASKAKEKEREQFNYAKKIFVVSSSLKKHLLQQYPSLNETKIIVVPNGVNPDKIKIDDDLKKQLKQNYSISDKSVVIGFVGSVFPYHGVDLLINSFSRIRKKYPDKEMKLFIIGDGYLIDELKQLSGKKNIINDVLFTGSVKHDLIFTYIDLMDIAVLAKSNWYCSPVKIFEYGVMGKAIIAPDAIPVKDVMIHEADGLLVSPDEEKISEAMMRLIAHADLRTALGNNFRKKVLENHTWNNTTGKILNYIIS